MLSKPSDSSSTPPASPRAYEVLADKIRRRVESGELMPGSRIPSENAIARDEAVSRSTVREALRKLEEWGVLERSSPRILVVRSAGEDIAFKEFNRALARRNVRFVDVYEALLLLEPAIVRYATERATAEDIAALRANISRQQACTDDPGAWHEASLLFHRQLAEVARNPALFLARASLGALLHPVVRMLYTTSEDVRRVYELNAAVADEVASGDHEGAAYAARKAVVGFGRAWRAAGHDLEELVIQLPAGSSGYAVGWCSPDRHGNDVWTSQA